MYPGTSSCYSGNLSGTFTTLSDSYITVSVELGTCSIGSLWSVGLSCDGSSTRILSEQAQFAEENIIMEAEDNLTALDISIEDKRDELSIYPNPVTNIINFRLSSEEENIKNIEIISADGFSVHFSKNINGKDFNLDIADFPLGIYFAKVLDSNNKYYLKKVIKI